MYLLLKLMIEIKNRLQSFADPLEIGGHSTCNKKKVSTYVNPEEKAQDSRFNI